jgi:DNA sulfur modification protein DndB
MVIEVENNSNATGLVEIIDCVKYEDAITRAHEELLDGGSVRLASLQQQGNRQHLIFSQPIRSLVSLARLDSATKADRANVESKSNRPIDQKHVEGIVHYLVGAALRGEKWILPPLTFNARTPVKAYTFGRGSNRGCFLVLNKDTEFFVTDGQHRLVALNRIREDHFEDAWGIIGDDYLAVTVVLEEDLKRVHQDFVDCSKVKQITTSLLKTWDQQDPLAQIARDLSDSSPLFKNRIDKLSGQLAKDPDYVLTMSQLTFVVGEFLFGTSQKARTVAAARTLKNSDEAAKRAFRTTKAFLNAFAEANDAWSECIKPGAAPDFYRLRLDRVDFNSAGMQVVARVGHNLYSDPSLTAEQRQVYIKKLGQLDYRRTATLWHKSIVSPEDLSLINKYATVDNAVDAVLKEIGYNRATADDSTAAKEVWE